MIACLDAGNSRLKWGLADAVGWQAQGALDWAEIQFLPELVAGWPVLERVLWASVAGEGKDAQVLQALADLPWQRITTGLEAGGVSNSYQQPERLGVDRWCALIGARALLQEPCLVVTAGTATTIDSLDGAGRFVGGMILPGLEMMRTSLAQGTARLPLASGAHQDFPRCTEDAIATGCLEAQVGAIERAFRRLPQARLCLLSGGAAPALLPHLQLPVQVVDNLVLEGLRRLAAIAAAP